MPNLPTTITPGFPGHIGDHEQMHAILDDLDTGSEFGIAQFKAGTLGNRPAAGIVGRLYFATDVPVLYVDTGASWVKAGSSVKRGEGTASAQLTLSSSYQDVPGTSFTINTLANAAPFIAIFSAEYNQSGMGGGTLETQLLVNGAAQGPQARFVVNEIQSGSIQAIATVAQVIEGTCSSAGNQTFKLQSRKTVPAGIADLVATNTNLVVIVLDG